MIVKMQNNENSYTAGERVHGLKHFGKLFGVFSAVEYPWVLCPEPFATVPSLTTCLPGVLEPGLD